MISCPIIDSSTTSGGLLSSMSKASARIESAATSKRLMALKIFGIAARPLAGIGRFRSQPWRVLLARGGSETADSVAVLRTGRRSSTSRDEHYRHHGGGDGWSGGVGVGVG